MAAPAGPLAIYYIALSIGAQGLAPGSFFFIYILFEI